MKKTLLFIGMLAVILTACHKEAVVNFSYTKRILNLRPSVTRLAWNLCEGVLPWLGFQSSQAFF